MKSFRARLGYALAPELFPRGSVETQHDALVAFMSSQKDAPVHDDR
jgi:hypothetical protein